MEATFWRKLFSQSILQSVTTFTTPRSLEDIERATDDESVDALAAQAIALARLAGFLAGQLPPEADLFRALIEAVSAGHAEPDEQPCSLRKTPSIPTLLLGFTFYLKQDILVIFQIFTNIDV